MIISILDATSPFNCYISLFIVNHKRVGVHFSANFVRPCLQFVVKLQLMIPSDFLFCDRFSYQSYNEPQTVYHSYGR